MQNTTLFDQTIKQYLDEAKSKRINKFKIKVLNCDEEFPLTSDYRFGLRLLSDVFGCSKRDSQFEIKLGYNELKKKLLKLRNLLPKFLREAGFSNYQINDLLNGKRISNSIIKCETTPYGVGKKLSIYIDITAKSFGTQVYYPDLYRWIAERAGNMEYSWDFYTDSEGNPVVKIHYYTEENPYWPSYTETIPLESIGHLLNTEEVEEEISEVFFAHLTIYPENREINITKELWKTVKAIFRPKIPT